VRLRRILQPETLCSFYSRQARLFLHIVSFSQKLLFHAVSNCSNRASNICRTICRSKSEFPLNHEKMPRKNRFGKRLAALFRRLLRSPDSLTNVLLHLHLTHVGSHTYRPEIKPLVSSWRTNCEVAGGPRRSIDTKLTSCGYIRPSPDSVWSF